MDMISPLLQWLYAHPQLAGLATFIISAAESVAIIGTIVPGSIMMTALGTLAGAGVIPLWGTIFWAIMGAIVGDGISYWLGFYFKDGLRRVWPFRNNSTFFNKVEVFVHKYGTMSVFIGRFVGPVRALVPLVAGMLGMKPVRFLIANVTSAIGWAPAYMLPGILLGAASLELPPDIAIHVILALLLLGLFILLCLWFIYKLFQLIRDQIVQLQNAIWIWLDNSPRLSPITYLLRYHDQERDYGQLTLALFFLITGILFLLLALYVRLVGPNHLMINDVFYHLFRGIHSARADNVMLYITFLGEKAVIIPVVLVLFAWLMICKNWRTAWHALILIVLAAGAVFVFKHGLQIPRPSGIAKPSTSFSMPSGHTTLAVVTFMGLAFLLSRSIKRPYRWSIYLVGALIALLVSVSRMYVGAHWFTDVLGGWLLSAAILMVVIISYQRKREKPVHPFGILGVCLVTLMITYSFYFHTHVNLLSQNYVQVDEPAHALVMQHWWQENQNLPAYRASLFGFPSQHINLEWTGDLNKIRETLIKEGWSKPPARDWISSMHRLMDISSTQYLQMVSPQYLDKLPILILTRPSNVDKGLLTLRLWEANRTILETNSPIWVGIVGIVPRSYSWLFRKHPGDVDINPTLVFPNKNGIGHWEWTFVTVNNQKIMLIRQNKFIHKKK